MPMIEFVWWPATAEFLEDIDAVIGPTVSYISSAEGCLGIYYGLQVEDSAAFWMVVVWESHGHHQSMMNSADYPQMVGRLEPFFNGELKMNHVEFGKEITSAFEATVTSVSFIRVKQANKNDKLVGDLLDELSRDSSAIWGTTQEETAIKILVIGLKKPYRESSNSDAPHRQANALQGLAGIEMIHVKFKRVFGAH